MHFRLNFKLGLINRLICDYDSGPVQQTFPNLFRKLEKSGVNSMKLVNITDSTTICWKNVNERIQLFVKVTRQIITGLSLFLVSSVHD